MQEVTTADNSGMYRASVAVVDVATGEVRTVTERAGTDSADLDWAPDSKRLLFTGIRDGQPLPTLEGPPEAFWPPEDIFAINVDGTGEVNISNTPDGMEGNARWSPDSAAIAFGTYTDERFELVIQPVQGNEPVGESRSIEFTGEFVWSPDAKLLLLVETEEVSPPNAEVQVLHSTMQIVDASFTEDPVTIGEWDFSVGGVSWQWLKP